MTTTNGPTRGSLRLIRRLAALTVVLGLVAVAGVVLGYIAVNQRISDITQSRELAAYDSCQLIRGLVLVATPRARLTQARSYIDRTPLRDCRSYELHIR